MCGDRKSPSNFVDVGLGLNVSTISSRSWFELFLDLKPVCFAMKIEKM